MTGITDDDLRAAVATSRAYTVVLLTATATYAEAGTPELLRAHARRNLRLRADGQLAVLCRVMDDSPLVGIGIFTGPTDEVAALMDGDPGVLAGIFTYQTHPVRGFPGDALPG
jgi:hypothetical protein